MTNLIISFICADRSGLVNDMSNVIKQHNGNWQASSLHQLSGHFAGAIEVAVPQEQATSLVESLNAIEGVSIVVQETQSSHEKTAPTLVLDLTANDRAGIVHEISSVIHHQGGNLLKLVSKHESAPHAGNELFKAKVNIAINESNADSLIEALEALADDLIVDISR